MDRAALDTAIELGLTYGGWCPFGGWAADRPDAPGVMADYPALRPTPRRDPGQRTLWNVRDSDATLVLLPGRAASPGTRRTIGCARDLRLPVHVADLGRRGAARAASRWLRKAKPARLNIAGPREGERTGTYAQAKRFLLALLSS